MQRTVGSLFRKHEEPEKNRCRAVTTKAAPAFLRIASRRFKINQLNIRPSLAQSVASPSPSAASQPGRCHGRRERGFLTGLPRLSDPPEISADRLVRLVVKLTLLWDRTGSHRRAFPVGVGRACPYPRGGVVLQTVNAPERAGERGWGDVEPQRCELREGRF